MNRIESIAKVVSGIYSESFDEIKVCSLIIEAGIHKASSIEVTVALQVVKNSKMDINIAFMNKCAMGFNRVEILTLSIY